MKSDSLISKGGGHYETPTLTPLTVNVEAGFSLSNEEVDNGGEQNPW